MRVGCTATATLLMALAYSSIAPWSMDGALRITHNVIAASSLIFGTNEMAVRTVVFTLQVAIICRSVAEHKERSLQNSNQQPQISLLGY